jgi:methylmalonyl-CoA mutase N-terminal domain/subunit
MTDDIERAVLDLMRRVEEMGGAVVAIERGFQRHEIEDAAYEVARGVDSGDRVVVGLNAFISDDDEPYEPLRLDPALESEQIARVAKVRARRDGVAVERALSALAATAAGPHNVLPPIKAALAARATLGEVCTTLRACWGRYKPQ